MRFFAKFRGEKIMLKFSQDRCGATAIEYALIAAGISIVVAGAVMLSAVRLRMFLSR